MAYELIKVRVEAEKVGIITLNRPQSLNSFTRQMHRDLDEAMAWVESNPGVRALVITGAGRGFCAGADLSEFDFEPGKDLVERADPGPVIDQAFNPTVRRLQEKQTRLDSTFRSQSTWDRTMAESVARAIADRRTPTLLVVGRFHIERHGGSDGSAREEGGTTQALRALSPAVRLLTVLFVDAWPEGDQLRPEDASHADVVVYIGPPPKA